MSCWWGATWLPKWAPPPSPCSSQEEKHPREFQALTPKKELGTFQKPHNRHVGSKEAVKQENVESRRDQGRKPGSEGRLRQDRDRSW